VTSVYEDDELQRNDTASYRYDATGDDYGIEAVAYAFVKLEVLAVISV
jgi:hypothetical protein